MIEFTNLFLSNFFGESLSTLLPTTTVVGGVKTSSVAAQFTAAGGEIESPGLSLLGTSTSSTASTVVDKAVDTYKETKIQLQDTQAYIESLNEEQLNELIAKLENKEYQYSLKENKVNIKTKTSI